MLSVSSTFLRSDADSCPSGGTRRLSVSPASLNTLLTLSPTLSVYTLLTRTQPFSWNPFRHWSRSTGLGMVVPLLVMYASRAQYRKR